MKTNYDRDMEMIGKELTVYGGDAASGSSAARGSVTELDGYRAAGIMIERMLDEAQKKCPKRLMKINRNSAAYRAGVYQAILTAHCWMVWGEYPNHERNKPMILKTLKSLNAGAEPPATQKL
tara:strand:+ start:387 stop:752 length:366 start_codon:yes stop_codon:yes gene_type:complete